MTRFNAQPLLATRHLLPCDARGRAVLEVYVDGRAVKLSSPYRAIHTRLNRRAVRWAEVLAERRVPPVGCEAQRSIVVTWRVPAFNVLQTKQIRDIGWSTVSMSTTTH